jgi:hypothetical protein
MWPVLGPQRYGRYDIPVDATGEQKTALIATNDTIDRLEYEEYLYEMSAGGLASSQSAIAQAELVDCDTDDSFWTRAEVLEFAEELGTVKANFGKGSSAKLGTNMSDVVAGEDVEVAGQAHHIVPINERGFEMARGALSLAEIDIDDIRNGADLGKELHTRAMHRNPQYRADLNAAMQTAIGNAYVECVGLDLDVLAGEVERVLFEFHKRLSLGEYTP